MMNRAIVLRADGVVNLLIGLPLVFFPVTLSRVLGLPVPTQAFWPSILGAVLCGIGAALLLESVRGSRRAIGLGLLGAATINVCGAVALVAWLIGGTLSLPARGVLILWAVAVVVAGLSATQLIMLVGVKAEERVG